MAEQYLPNYAGNILGAFQQGQDRGRQSKLAQLLGTAVNDPAQRQSALGQAAMIDPGAAMSAKKSLNDESLADLSRDAGMFLSLPDDQKAVAYPQLAQKAQQVFGHLLPTNYDPKYAPMIEKLAASAGGQQQLAPHVIGNALVGNDGKVLYQGQQAPSPANLVNVPDGNGGFVQKIFDPRTRTFSDPNYDGSPQDPMQGIPTDSGVPVDASAALDPTKDYPQLASAFPGTQISSLLRTPEHNAAVGGVANSQHIKGTAGDFVVPKAEQAAFIAKAKSEGYEVIPEGDHIHLELPNGRKASSTFAQSGRLGHTPPKASSDSAPSGYQWDAGHTKLQPIPGGPADTGGDYQLSSDAINNSAWDFIMTGTKPQFARSHEGDKQRIAIQNEVAKIAKDAGVTPQELSTQKGKFKALQASMNNIQKQSDMMDKANETFHRNADLMLSLSGKVPRYDSAAINKYVLDYRLKWSGDSATAAYIAAARTAINEYAKIASGASGSAGSTDSSRREAEEAISSAQNPKQLAAVIQTLKQDAENQKNATHDQIIAIGSRMSQFGGNKPAASATKILKFNPATGKIE